MRFIQIGTLTAVLSMVYPGLAITDPLSAPLRERFDAGLQRELEMTLNRLQLIQAVRGKQLSVALVDITDLTRPRVAAINGDEMLYAASLPKIAILLGAFVLIERGEMILDEPTRETLTKMIRYSSNKAATEMLNRVGMERLAKILQSDRFRLYDPAVNGGLWVGKDYGNSPVWRRDPLHKVSHGATVLQTARFYYLLETERLVSRQLCRVMKEILSKPALRHKFVKGLEARPGARIYRKSGTWRHWHADSAIVERDDYKYIVAALARHSHGGRWMSQLIVPLNDLIVRSHP